MPECDHCGSHVSDDFVRVFASRDGQIGGCPHCKDRTLGSNGYREAKEFAAVGAAQ